MGSGGAGGRGGVGRERGFCGGGGGGGGGDGTILIPPVPEPVVDPNPLVEVMAVVVALEELVEDRKVGCKVANKMFSRAVALTIQGS